MVVVLVLVGLCSGCSVSWRDHVLGPPPISGTACPSYVRPAIDAAAAGTLGVVAGDAYVHRNDADC